ncbi:MAG: DUF2341 domain-containing protein, partial [Candidatus Margulisbacteria bacterium]|nr:DUF2341 domain-containing protein [Candidatus Margulisiibacteriota bacterium]
MLTRGSKFLLPLVVLLAGACVVWALSSPTVDSLSVTHGPTAGGTSVTITGTDFLPSDFSRTIEVTNSNSVVLTDHQVLVTLETQTLVDSGRMRADRGDIRFYDTDGTTPLSYWLETTEASVTRLWVKVPTLEAGTTKNIFLKYGDISLSPASNGTGTFIYFDDFNDGNYTGWTLNSGAGAVITAENGELSISFPSDLFLLMTAEGTAGLSNYIAEAGVTLITASSQTYNEFGLLGRYSNNSNLYVFGQDLWEIKNQALIGKEVGGSWSLLNSVAYTYTVGVKARWKYSMFGSALKFYVNDTLFAQATDTSLTSGYFGLNVGDRFSGGHIHFDDMRIRRYATAEPTASVKAETGSALQVSFGGTAATSVTYISSTQVSAVTPPHAAGLVDVTVTNPDGQVAAKTNAFNYWLPPVVYSVTPGSGLSTGEVVVTITGEAFQLPGEGTTSVRLVNGVLNKTATAVNVTSATELTCTLDLTDLAYGAWDVQVINPDGQTGTRTGGFNVAYPPPTVLICTPDIGQVLGGTGVTITGTNFMPGSIRRTVTVNNSGAALTDYQVLVTLEASLITDGKMKSDGGDIRFYDADGTTALSYWIESATGSAPTRVWVKVPSLPNGGKTIYLTYGDLSLPSQSNGANTFDFFDDFSGDLSKWVTDGGTWNTTGGTLNFASSGTAGFIFANSSAPFSNYIMDYKWYCPTGLDGGMIHRAQAKNNDNFYCTIRRNPNSDHYFHRRVSDGWGSAYNSVSYNFPDNTWLSVRETFAGTTLSTKFYSDQLFSSLVSQNSWTEGSWSSGYVGVYNYLDNNAKWDDFRIRKYAATEPTVSVGSETGNSLRAYFGGVPATSVTRVDVNTITVDTPAHAVETVEVTVVNPDGQAATAEAAFTYKDTYGYWVDASSTEGNVSGDGSPERPFQTITYAMSQITTGRISVRAGTYSTTMSGSKETFPLTVKSGVYLRSVAVPSTAAVIDAAAAAALVMSANTTLEGFSVRNNTTTAGYYTVNLAGTRARLINNNITNAAASGTGYPLYVNATAAWVEGNTISGGQSNTVNLAASALYAVLKGNTI